MSKSPQKFYADGVHDSLKFAARRDDYYDGLKKMLELGYSPADYIHQFPIFTGHMTLARMLTLYELYKKTLGLAGHVAEVGVEKGFGSLLFAKLMQIHEPEAFTMVHGFDWFKGIDATKEESLLRPAEGENEARLRALITAQKLDHLVKIHTLDVTKEIDAFFDEHKHLRFKLVLLDCGTYAPSAAAIKAFWPRIVPGGILALDQYGLELTPGETRAVDECLPGYKVETLPGTWMPTAFIQKPFVR